MESNDALTAELRGQHGVPVQEECPPPLDVRGIFQLTGMTLGIGVFVIPSAFVGLGWAHATAWLTVLCCLANAAMQCLLDIAAERNVTSYGDLMELAFGGLGKLAIEVTVVVTCFTVMLSYLSTARDLLSDVSVAFLLDADVNAAPNGVEVLGKVKSVVVLAILIVAMLPMLLSPSIDAKAWVSQCSVCSLIAASAFFLARCAKALAVGCHGGLVCGHPPALIQGSLTDILDFSARLAFSFSMIFVIFPVLKDRVSGEGEGAVARAVPQMKRVARFSVVLCFSIYLAIGLAGSITLGSATKGVALRNLPLSDPLAQLLSLMVGSSLVLLVPVISFPTIEGLLALLGCSEEGTKRDRVRPVIVAALAVAAVLIDAFLPTPVAFALAGSVGVSLVAYAFPGVLFFRLAADSPQRGSRLHALLVMVTLLVGLMLLLGSTPVILERLIESSPQGSRPAELHAFVCQTHSR